MSFIKDSATSIRDQITERMSSPILGSFVIAWLIWNYKVPFILFSDTPVQFRFELVRKLVYPTDGHLLGFALAGPLLTSLAYLFVYPWISLKILKHYDARQAEIANMRHAAQMRRLLTVEEADRLQGAHQEVITRQNAVIENQRNELKHVDIVRKDRDAAKKFTTDLQQKIEGMDVELQNVRKSLEDMTEQRDRAVLAAMPPFNDKNIPDLVLLLGGAAGHTLPTHHFMNSLPGGPSSVPGLLKEAESRGLVKMGHGTATLTADGLFLAQRWKKETPSGPIKSAPDMNPNRNRQYT